MAGHFYINMVTMVLNRINKMLRGKIDRMMIIILSIMPRSDPVYPVFTCN